MLWIARQEEPIELTDWRRENKKCANHSYQSLPGNVQRAVKAALLRDQRYLCAYTMRRIAAETSHIEHFKARSKHHNEEVSYSNMLACYPGGTVEIPYGAKNKRAKGNVLNPHDCEVDKEFRYAIDGQIIGNSELAKRTIEILNLNHELLCANRNEVMRSWKQKLLAEKPSEGRCRQMLAAMEADERLPEYYGVIRQVLSDHAQHQAKRAQRLNREKRE